MKQRHSKITPNHVFSLPNNLSYSGSQKLVIKPRNLLVLDFECSNNLAMSGLISVALSYLSFVLMKPIVQRGKRCVDWRSSLLTFLVFLCSYFAFLYHRRESLCRTVRSIGVRFWMVEITLCLGRGAVSEQAKERKICEQWRRLEILDMTTLLLWE